MIEKEPFIVGDIACDDSQYGVNAAEHNEAVEHPIMFGHFARELLHCFPTVPIKLHKD